MIKEKKWYWWFTILANPTVNTTIHPHIYVSNTFHSLSKKSQDIVIKHEEVHLEQQQKEGLLKYLFFYIFCFPLFYNPWRYKWEMDAYKKAGYSEEKAKEYVSSYYYGWLQG